VVAVTPLVVVLVTVVDGNVEVELVVIVLPAELVVGMTITMTLPVSPQSTYLRLESKSLSRYIIGNSRRGPCRHAHGQQSIVNER